MRDAKTPEMLAQIYTVLHPDDYTAFLTEQYGAATAAYLSKWNRLDTELLKRFEDLGFDIEPLIAYRTTHSSQQSR